MVSKECEISAWQKRFSAHKSFVKPWIFNPKSHNTDASDNANIIISVNCNARSNAFRNNISNSVIVHLF